MKISLNTQNRGAYTPFFFILKAFERAIGLWPIRLAFRAIC